MNNIEITLLTEGQIKGNSLEEKLDIIEKYKSCSTDLAILTGADQEKPSYYTKTFSGDGNVLVLTRSYSEIITESKTSSRRISIRPVLKINSSYDFYNLTKDMPNLLTTIRYGEYPQKIVNKNLQKRLTEEYKNNCLCKTGRTYTFDSTYCSSELANFKPITYEEYEYCGKKYIQVSCRNLKESYTAVGIDFSCHNTDVIWVEVCPVEWFVDQKNQLLISEYNLLTGVRFDDSKNKDNDDFEKTEMKYFLDNYMKRDILQSVSLNYIEENNINNLNIQKVSEEDMIKTLIDNDVPVYLHGKSNIIKHSIIKHLGYNYLPISFEEIGLTSNKPFVFTPSWLKKIRELNEEEPDKINILFFYNITKAILEEQQQMVNMIETKQIKELGKLPSNVRIVLTSNDFNESSKLCQSAEMMYNSCAHVYIDANVSKWLKYASYENIHPVILAFIGYKKDHILNDINPSVNLNKWELASTLLYQTNNPYMLVSIIGEQVTKELCDFCNSKAITLDQVLYSNYLPEYDLTEKEKYATLVGLSEVDEENVKIVRSFVRDNLGKDLVSVFDIMWAKGNEDRLELLEEINKEEISSKKRILTP